MNPDLWFLPLLAADVEEPTRSQRLFEWFSLSGPHVGSLLSGFALAMLVLLVLPRRHDRAVLRCGASPLRAWLIGVLVTGALAAAIMILVRAGIRPGRPLLSVLLVTGLAAGVSVSGRALAARVLEDRGALVQTAVGAGVLMLSLCAPIGLVVLAIAGPIGLGGLLLARR